MKMPDTIEKSIIAPCGVCCLACGGYLKAKTPCPGCRALTEEHNRKSCMNCAKKKCAFGKGLTWCFECGKFPCLRIKDLNKRYIQNYGIDLVQDGLDARNDLEAHAEALRKRFTCACGGIIDQHHRKCSECGKAIT